MVNSSPIQRAASLLGALALAMLATQAAAASYVYSSPRLGWSRPLFLPLLQRLPARARVARFRGAVRSPRGRRPLLMWQRKWRRLGLVFPRRYLALMARFLTQQQLNLAW